MKFIFQILKRVYEKARYTPEERAIRALALRFKNEIKRACFRLGFMNIMVNMDNYHEVLKIVNKENKDIELFTFPEAKNKMLMSCKRHIKEFHQEYLTGLTAFQEIQSAVKACATN